MKSILILISVLLAAVLILLANTVYLDDEQKIYKVLFEEFKHQAIAEKVLFQSKPRNCLAYDENTISGIPPELIAAFELANRKDAVVVDLDSLRGDFNIVKYQFAKRFYKEDTRIPNTKGYTLIKLTRVGFNTSKTEALACVAGHTGNLVHLKKHGREWSVLNWHTLW